MKTLYEKIVTADTRYLRDIEKEIVRDTKESQIILADNVSDYYYQESDQEYWEFEKDFPNLAPPFEKMFIEWKAPKYIRSGGTISKVEPEIFTRHGALIVSKERPAGEDSEIRWTSAYMSVCLTTTNVFVAQNWAMVFFIDDNGRLVKPSLDESMAAFVFVGPDKETLERARDYNLTGIFNPALLAISFMHCKNVHLVSNMSKAPSQPGKRRRHAPKYEYHILEIEPMKRVLRTEGNSESNGLLRAMHICRGHFKDYTEKGLFGKYHGIYWWDSQMRGDIASGFVDKDYSIGTNYLEI